METIQLAGCAILKKGGLLLLHRIKTDWFELPGGKTDSDETVEQAAIRELREEILCDVELVRKLGTEGFTENGKILVYTWFLGKLKDGQKPIIGEPEKFDRFEYIQIKELPNAILSPNMQNFAKALEKKGFVL